MKPKYSNMVLVFLVLIICLVPLTKASAHYIVTGHLDGADNSRYYYDDPGPLIGYPIPTAWRPYIGLAALDWSSQSSNIELYSTLDTSGKNYVNVEHYMYETAATWMLQEADGTIKWYRISFNSSLNFYTDERKYNVKTVALHEFGHALGLGDIPLSMLNEDKAHIMYYAYTSTKPLHPHDIAGIIYIYGQ